MLSPASLRDSQIRTYKTIRRTYAGGKVPLAWAADSINYLKFRGCFSGSKKFLLLRRGRQKSLEIIKHQFSPDILKNSIE